jgi:hypothetical protein
MSIRLFVSLVVLVNVFAVGAVLLVPKSAYAQAQGICSEEENPSFLFFPPWYKFLDRVGVDQDGDGTDDSCELSVEIPQDAGKILLAVFEIILRISGIAAVGYILYGGFQYILSQGEPEQTKGAKSTILNAFIGLVVAMLAVAIVNIIGRNIT